MMVLDVDEDDCSAADDLPLPRLPSTFLLPLFPSATIAASPLENALDILSERRRRRDCDSDDVVDNGFASKLDCTTLILSIGCEYFDSKKKTMDAPNNIVKQVCC